MKEPTPNVSDLFKPCELKGVTLKNRFVMPGMQRGWNDRGAQRAEMADYYRRRVDGDVASERLISEPDWVNKVRGGRYEQIESFRKADIANLEWESDWAE
jgi:2,4-dienoyl-CoA reductase-like NADH-dependent reductase (Old Yellow Enzyme family)